MTVAVVKVGGVLLEDAAASVARIQAVGADRFVVVHGGGVQITRMLERMNVQSQFIDGDHAGYVGEAAAYYIDTRLRSSAEEQQKYCRPLGA